MAAEAIKKSIRAGDIDSLEEANFEDYGLDVNSELGSDGYAALHWACHYGREEVVQHLLELGADMHQCTHQGWTGAHICAIRGCTTCLNELCSSGIDLYEPDSRGYTCMHLAAAHGKSSALQAIIKTGMDMTTVDRRGWNIVHHAAFHGRLNVLQMVMSLRIDANASDNEGNTPAHLAAMEGHLECLKLLVQNKSKSLEVLTSRNNDGAMPKDLAKQFQKQDCMDFLAYAKSEAEIYEFGDTDEFPGHTAASEGNVQLLGMLLTGGHCEVDDQDEHGSTAAHKAAGNGHLECLQLLLDHGANINLKNGAGDTPKDVAKKYAQQACLALLTAADSGSGDESMGDQPISQAVVRAAEKVEELQHLLDAAKTQYKQLGGKLPEDKEMALAEKKHRKEIADFESQLEYERERREELEAQLDQMRKRLRESVTLIEHYKSLNTVVDRTDSMTTLTGIPDPSPEHHHHPHRQSKKRSSSKRVPSTGGVFVKIGHV